MELIATHPTLFILGALLSGGVGTHFIGRFFMSKKDEADVARDLYSALSAQVTSLSNRVESLQHTVDDWRGKYFKLLEDYTELKIENTRLRAELDLINPKPALYRDPTHPTV
jgi:hypothetical protein